MAIKVAKFGGSSLADVEQFKKVKEIITSDPERRYIVPSAPGKRHSGDSKITDMLYECARLAQAQKDFSEVFKQISLRYFEIQYGLGLETDIDERLIEISENIQQGFGPDYAASRGEYLNGILLAAYLGFAFIDAEDVICIHANGKPDLEKTAEICEIALKDVEYAVIPGFYGSCAGKIKTFSRGGSDISGAIVANAVHADLYENWTDVPGFLMADPRIVNNPEIIRELTFRELRELSYMGATVLHEESIFPVREAKIPINVKNTNDPSQKGTLIHPERASSGNMGAITGIAGRKGFSVFLIEKPMMNAELGFVRRALSLLESMGISFEHMPSGIDTLSLVICDDQLNGKEQQLIEKLKITCDTEHVVLYSNMALIATVGQGMQRSVGVSGKLFGALANEGINVRMIDQGSSELNIIIGVETDDFEKAVQAIYKAFVE